MPGSVLIIDDEQQLSSHLGYLLKAEGYETTSAATGAQAQMQMMHLDPDVVLMDLHLPDANGADLLSRFKKSHPDVQVIIITGHGSIRSAVETTQRGAVDYLTKPLEPDVVLLAVANAMARRALADEVRALRTVSPGLRSRLESLERCARSVAMSEALAMARRIAAQDSSVLLLGESGTGKNVLANWIHAHSSRGEGPLFIINCAALSRELAEAELFGHEPGAYTGAAGRKRGLLELAQQGTLVLDEAGELDLALQSKLLTFLDTRSFVRVGGEKTVTVDARILACTNQDLEQMVQQGRFRRDLYYRLNVLSVKMPSLRDRRDDIPLLTRDMLADLAVELRLNQLPTLQPEALDRLLAYTWPGNLRELRNVLERALMVCHTSHIGPGDLALAAADAPWHLEVPFPTTQGLHEVTRDVARALVQEALRRGRSKQEAARLLGLSRHALAHQLKVLELEA